VIRRSQNWPEARRKIVAILLICNETRRNKPVSNMGRVRFERVGAKAKADWHGLPLPAARSEGVLPE